MSDRSEQIQGISGKPGYALGQNNINFSRLAVCQKPLKLLPLCYPGAADSQIRIHAGIFPLWITLYQPVVVIRLCPEGSGETLGIRGHPHISRNLKLFPTRWHPGLYPSDFRHKTTSFRIYFGIAYGIL